MENSITLFPSRPLLPILPSSPSPPCRHYWYGQQHLDYQSCLLSLCQIESYWNVIRLHANQSYFHMKGFARFVSKRRQKVTRKWPILILDSPRSPSSWWPVAVVVTQSTPILHAPGYCAHFAIASGPACRQISSTLTHLNIPELTNQI